ncbi:MAG: riboflavin synthase subunit alpha, partial [Psittacicella sp.]
NFMTYGVILSNTKDLLIGASVANNGVCLTVTKIEDDVVYFDIMQETLKVTNLSNVRENDLVNIERSMVFGSEIGGHILSGHILTTIEVKDIVKTPTNTTFIFDLYTTSVDIRKYIFQKGFIALNGASLTLNVIDNNTFQIHFIPETLVKTTFGQSKVGDKINLEVDSQTVSIVETVENFLSKNR